MSNVDRLVEPLREFLATETCLDPREDLIAVVPDPDNPEFAPVHITALSLSEIGATAFMDTLNENRPGSTEACLVLLGSTVHGVEPDRLLSFDPASEELTLLAEVLPEKWMFWMAQCLAMHDFLRDQGIPPELLDDIVDPRHRDNEEAANAYAAFLGAVMGDVSDELDQKLRGDTARLYVLEVLAPLLVDLAHVKIGRNAPCPCGSGRKYKKCCA